MINMKRKEGLKWFFREGTSDVEAVRYCMNPRDIFWMEYTKRSYGIETVVEIGTHIGTFALPVLSEGKRVVAVEPDKESAMLAEINAVANGLSLEAVRFAIGSMPEMREFVSYETDTRGNQFRDYSSDVEGANNTTVPTITLEELFFHRKVDKCDFLKVNCEGAEFEIFETAPLSVLRKITCIVCEVHPDFVPTRTVDDLIAVIEKKGFQLDKKYDVGQPFIVMVRRGA